MQLAIPPISVAVEGPIDEQVARRLLQFTGLPCGMVYGKQGKDYIVKHLDSYNHAAIFLPWFILVDLDKDAACAPSFLDTVLAQPSKGMCFRIVVRAVEAWLLADIDNLASFLHVPKTKFPAYPDDELDPKTTLVNLVTKHSRREAIRQAIVPSPGWSVGAGYAGRLIEFITTGESRWRPEIAVERSDSLRRCIAALHTLKYWK